MKFSFQFAKTPYEIELIPAGANWQARVGDRTLAITGLHSRAGALRFQIDGKTYRAFWAQDGARRWLWVDGQTYVLTVPDQASRRRAKEGASDHGERQLLAPMPGQVRAVEVKEGDAVEKGQTLLLLEAMKMEIRVTAARSGRVRRLLVEQGQAVEREQLLAEIE